MTLKNARNPKGGPRPRRSLGTVDLFAIVIVCILPLLAFAAHHTNEAHLEQIAKFEASLRAEHDAIAVDRSDIWQALNDGSGRRGATLPVWVGPDRTRGVCTVRVDDGKALAENCRRTGSVSVP